jgi:hypothetical protein
MTYDSGLPHSALYALLQRDQTIAASRALDGLAAELLIGVPTSEEHTVSHSPAAVTGVAIYPDWETDAAEWETYRTLWLGLR